MNFAFISLHFALPSKRPSQILHNSLAIVLTYTQGDDVRYNRCTRLLVRFILFPVHHAKVRMIYRGGGTLGQSDWTRYAGRPCTCSFFSFPSLLLPL